MAWQKWTEDDNPQRTRYWWHVGMSFMLAVLLFLGYADYRIVYTLRMGIWQPFTINMPDNKAFVVALVFGMLYTIGIAMLLILWVRRQQYLWLVCAMATVALMFAEELVWALITEKGP